MKTIEEHVLAVLEDGPAQFSEVKALVAPSFPEMTRKRDGFRVLDRALQKMRKAGTIRYQSKSKSARAGWVVAGERRST